MPKLSISRTVSAGLSLAAFATMFVMSAGSAAADSQYTPDPGELCRARENINFYVSNNSTSTYSYQVAKDDFIRIDGYRDGRWVKGHGENHVTRWFQWEHSPNTDGGASRVYNCVG